MDNKKFKNYLIAKYSIKDNSQISSLIQIDAMDHFLSLVSNEGIILKGAFNLFKNFGYTRNKITRDIDFSLIKLNIKDIYEVIDNAIKDGSDIYEYEITSIVDLDISTNGYSGLRIKTAFKVKDTNIKGNFHSDYAIEDITNGHGILGEKGNRYYSIDRTLADKYVTMIQRGSTNTRDKDFVDLKNLFKEVNIELFYKLVKELISIKGISTDLIKKFNDEYTKYPSVIKNNLVDVIRTINKEIINI